MTKLLKVVLVLMIISIISITPQAFAQISLGTPAEHVTIKVTIEENGDVSIVHVVKKSNTNVQVKLLPGTVENLQVVDGAGNEIQHAVSTDNSIVTLFPPKVDFGVEYDLKDALILKDGVWTWDFLYTESKNGVEFYFPDEADLIFVNDRPVRIDSAEGMRCHGCQMKNLEYVIDEPIILKEVEWEEQKFLVSISTLDEINSFNFDQPKRMLSFENTQEDRFITIIIPLELLWNPYDVSLGSDNIDNHQYYQNDTHAWLNIKPETVGTVKIIGISAIPEFSLLLPLVLGIAIVIGFQAKNKINLH
jgi:hypothetical protein